MLSPALKLAEAHERREAEGRPENLTEIIQRTRFAAEWNQKAAETARESARKFGKLAKVEEYTLQQREDATFAAAHEFGVATVREDAARTLDSIADALCALVADVAPL